MKRNEMILPPTTGYLSMTRRVQINSKGKELEIFLKTKGLILKKSTPAEIRLCYVQLITRLITQDYPLSLERTRN